MRKRFLYYFKKDDSTYYVVSGGIVIQTTVKTPFSADPIEWSETNLQYTRNVLYHGITFKYAAPLSLVKDAALILRHVMILEGGMEAPCIFVAEIIDDNTQLYSAYYTCDVDLSVAANTDNYVQVELLERGLYQMIKDRENTPYEIPIESADRIAVYHDGIGLEGDYVNSTVARSAAGFNSTQMWAVETLPIGKDGDFSTGESRAQTYMSMQSPIGTTPVWGFNTAEHNNYIYKVDQWLDGGVDISLRIFQQITYTNPSGTGMDYHIELRVYKSPSTTVTGATLMATIYDDSAFPLAPGSAPRTVLINATYPIGHLNPDERLYYIWYINGPGGSGGANTSDVGFYGNQRIEILQGFRLNPTFMYGYWYSQLFAKLVAKMTGGVYGSRSDFLSQTAPIVDNHPAKTLVISGDGVRNIGTSLLPAVIKTTLRDLYTDASARWQLGLGAEADGSGGFQIRLEPLSYFYDNSTVILELGLVNRFEWKYALEFVHGQLSIGNQNFEYDKLNGKDEPNTTQVYKLPITRKQDDWSLVAKYRADMYGIETVRANLTDKKTTDSASDNDVFVMEMDDTPSNHTIGNVTVTSYAVRRDQNISGNSASGIKSPSTGYNFSLSPKRNLIRNGSVIRAAAFQQEGKDITFQTTDKNAELISNLGYGTVTEKANMPVSSLDNVLFMPILFSFETPVPVNLPSIIEANPYGKIQFNAELGGQVKTFEGFIYDVSIKPGTNAACQWQILAGPDTVLSDLIF